MALTSPASSYRTSSPTDPVGGWFTLTDTTGARLRFHDFSSSLPANQQGQLESYRDPFGTVTAVTDRTTDGKTAKVQRSAPAGADTVTESYVYAYLGSGANAGLLQSVTLQRQVNSRSETVVRKVEYTYYGDSEPHGNAGDLKTALIKDRDENVLDTKYYRYYKPGENHGYPGALKYAFEPQSFARLAAVIDPFTATDEEVAPYADVHLKYDSQHRVVEQRVQGLGCSSCTGGIGTFTFTYSSSTHGNAYNVWKYKTGETLPDGNQNIVYSNFAGEVMLKVFRDTVSGQEWLDYYRYDAQGRMVLHAMPSAVTGYSEVAPDLLGNQSGNFQYLADDAGVIERTDYYTTTTATEMTAGGAAGYVYQTWLQRGETDPGPLLQSTTQYFSRTDTAANATIFPIATETVYRNAGGSGGQTTSYSYMWHGGTTEMASMTVTRPVITADQNGPDSPDTEATTYDIYGRMTTLIDGDNFVTSYAYDPATSALTQMVVDEGGLELTTSYQVDALGRTIQMSDPNENVTYIVYRDAAHEVRTYAGWQDATDRPTGPTVVQREHRPAAGSGQPLYYETLTMSALPQLDGNQQPTGDEAIAAVWTLSRSYTNAAGQTSHTDDYFDLAGLPYATAPDLGGEGLNFYRSAFGYDDRGRRNRTQSPTGTVARTVYDGLDRMVSSWVGTSDAQATNSDPTGGAPGQAAGNNMIRVMQYTYDGGGVGDSNLTQMIEYPSGGSVTTDQRVTDNFYDWRNRLVASKAGVQQDEDQDTQRLISYMEYDNLSQVIASEQYDGDGVTVVDGDMNGVPDRPDPGLLRARTLTFYDDLGRVFRTETFSVHPETGDVSADPLTGNLWYNHRGQLIKTAAPGGLVSKTQYDGAGRVTKSFTTDPGDDMGWEDALTVAGEKVLSQVETTYDANGNAILVVSKDRFHDADSTDELSSSNARVSYQTAYHDAIDRTVAMVDYGTNDGIAVSSRPPDLPDPADPPLVTRYGYHAAGWRDTVLDPRGITTRTYHDGLGRVTKEVEALTLTTLASPVVNQEQAPDDLSDAGAWWEDLGTVTVTGSELLVELSDAADEFVIADAVRVERLDALQVVDDGDAGFDAGGFTEATGQGFGDDLHFSVADSGNTATWSFAVAPGTYRVSATWTADPNRASNAPFTIRQGGVPGTASDRSTEYTYDGSNHILTLTAWEAGATSYQRTQFVYGVTTAGGSAINSNDLLRETRYPDRTTGDPSTQPSDIEIYTYNALGQMLTRSDRNGSVHSYSYDVLGRLTADAVTQLGGGVDDSVLRIEMAYDSAARPFLFTSYDAAAGAAGGNVVNQVQRVYNGLGQLIAEYQSHSGPVDTMTPKVEYAYTEMAGGVNHSRLTSMTYPNGRVLNYNYDGSNGLDDSISRLSSMSDNSTLETYKYLGLGTVVRRAHPEADLELTYIGTGGDSGDPYRGLDRFGRVAEQLWQHTSNSTPTDSFAYGYDRNSSRLYRQNLIEATFSELYHANGAGEGYDLLNQLTAFRRGALSDTNSDDVPDTVDAPSRHQEWAFDALGNWGTLTTDGTPEDRTHNRQNQLTALGSNTTFAFDGNGNLIEERLGKAVTKTWQYDAWNRLVTVTDGSTPLVAYTHDALNRRVLEDRAGTVNDLDLYYSLAWQVLEERVSGTTTAKAQYVWSPVYVDALVLRDRDANGESGDGLEERLYVQQDANWNVTALVDAVGNVVERYVEDAYGKVTVLNGSWQTLGDVSESQYAWVYLHQGGRYETVSALYHFRYRDYSPQLGRFIQRDPIEFTGGDPNLYRNVRNNPVVHVDPSGLLDPGTAIGAAALAGKAGAGGVIVTAVPVVIVGVGIAAVGVTTYFLVDATIDLVGASNVNATLEAERLRILASRAVPRALPDTKTLTRPKRQPKRPDRRTDTDCDKEKKPKCKVDDSHGAIGAYPGPYANLEGSDNIQIRAGRDFTQRQREKILAQNRAMHGGKLVSDLTGEKLVEWTGARTDTPDNAAEIDHIKPSRLRGSNSYCNARVVAKGENRPGPPRGSER